MQLGFDLDWHDATTGEVVPFSTFNEADIQDLEQAPWVFNDLETTNLTRYCEELNTSGKDIRRGVFARPRLRIFTVLFPSKIMVTKQAHRLLCYDFDKMTSEQRVRIARATLDGKMYIAHNAGFDLGWVMEELRDPTKPPREWAKPKYVLDTMLLARVLRPEQPVLLAQMATDQEEDPSLSVAAFNAIMQFKSGWGLAELCLTLLREEVDKGMQHARNWAEPFLSQEAFNYATNDTFYLHRLFCELLQCELDDDLLAVYENVAATTPTVKLIEPQVHQLCMMKLKGVPWDKATAVNYAEKQAEVVKGLVQQIVELEPSLSTYAAQLSDMTAGEKENLKKEIASLFNKHLIKEGKAVKLTEQGAPQVGEKDLRQVKAQIIPGAKELFDLWVGIKRAKKRAAMALEFSTFADRAVGPEFGDWSSLRIYPDTGFGPVTGRAKSSNPNLQQVPKDQGIRDCVRARKGMKIIGNDYNALDVVVGACCALNAQRQIREAFATQTGTKQDVLKAINRVYNNQITYEQAKYELEKVRKEVAKHREARADRLSGSESSRKEYWKEYRILERRLLLARFTRALSMCRANAIKDGTVDWSNLRNAFNIKGMDIHTFTTLAMNGENPAETMKTMTDLEIAAFLKEAKKRIGDRRQSGKVANLSLMYAMGVQGLVDTAAKSYNIHWSWDEAETIHRQWLEDSYSEVDLWHCWRALNPAGQVMMPDPEKGGRVVPKDYWVSYTLGGRPIYSFTLNAALSYEDQATGADIVAKLFSTLFSQHTDVFDTIMNQIHDEVLFEVDEERVEELTAFTSKMLIESAEFYTMRFGVHANCGPAVGDTWLKD